MGLFSKRPASSSGAVPKVPSTPNTLDRLREPHTFWMPCTGAEVAEALREYGESRPDVGPLGRLIRDYVDKYANSLGVIASPPLSPAVYVETITDSLIAFRAGNRVEEYWRLEIRASPEGDGSAGVMVMVSEHPGFDYTWDLQLVDLAVQVWGAVRSAGEVRSWPSH